MSRIRYGLKAVAQLGLRSSAWYALYQLGRISGHFERVSRYGPAGRLYPDEAYSISALIDLPSKEALEAVLGSEGKAAVLAEAEEIARGKARLFGQEPVSIRLSSPGADLHWTKAERSFQDRAKRSLQGTEPPVPYGDIKFVWEPARFTWLPGLFRAYLLSGEERYPQAFWRTFETFEQANPPDRGLNWASAQEVALRLVMLAVSGQVFAGSVHSTPERLLRLGKMIEASARRILPSLSYARAQRNNHLLSESLGLYIAGAALTALPEARTWRETGWRIFDAALRDQISREGIYIQQSTNYHRLMLQLALLARTVGGREGQGFRDETNQRLAGAVEWLLSLVDRESGRAPNLGPNDGAYIFPAGCLPFEDYRPVLQAAASEFLGYLPFPVGPWDEMLLWLGSRQPPYRDGMSRGDWIAADNPPARERTPNPCILRSPASRSWAYLRSAHFEARPGHADQLHLDLWWRGLNLAQDAGTFLYNAGPPWDNSLALTRVHNTVTVNGMDQMTRAGRFLWLDWAQARLLDLKIGAGGAVCFAEAEHNGYERQGVLHRRSVEARDSSWVITDRLLSRKKQRSQAQYNLRLHWLLPDFLWKLEQETGLDTVRLFLETSYGIVELEVNCPSGPCAYSLARGGELLAGSGEPDPARGWASPSYGSKIPALSFAVETEAGLPVQFTSIWRLPPDEGSGNLKR